ncbi:long-chain-fatty-acid--protein ligase LuxE [Vibrio sagamiensis]|uniref:Long-chain-fatty-acid--CoA ligase n=1 Tax=Vibrio sagamiensis NBRC 104589 TaxID=1219064 RepID=A0A511QJ08_9VIBR|nr:long-chain-fatty-acid--CoA ligase [Vibrio sagamiensis]PNQ56225.1 long-chain fatty acid--CoA ligase [Vibrio agarivorans]GEM77314.1 long-chain-fatty-acid--CoA ligase [Vibrio sagamiensis NBRC 104589]
MDVISAVKQENIAASTEIDDLIFMGTPEKWSLRQQKELTFNLVKEAYQYHYQNNEDYRNFCQNLGAKEDIDDLNSIPVFPTSIFKLKTLITVEEELIENSFTSSGTSGVKSIVARDRLSIERLLGSVNYGMKYVGDWFDHQMELVNLGPDRFNANNIWFKYVMSLVELLYPTAFTVNDDQIDFEATIANMERIKKSGKTICLIGPPYFIYLLCRYMQEEDRTFVGGSELFIITGGGWKKHQNESLNREEFNKLLMETFSLESDRQVRDTFNQVELNTCFFEDIEHKKRVPPWVYARALDPVTLSPLPHGEQGLMSYMDASAVSYPCFLVTDDIGIVREEEGERPGTTIEIVRRVNTRGVKGCALSLSQAFKRKDSKEGY